MAIFTSKTLEKITAEFHRCGHANGAVPNLNPTCGCMCGRVYDRNGKAIISMLGREAPSCRCQHNDYVA